MTKVLVIFPPLYAPRFALKLPEGSGLKPCFVGSVLAVMTHDSVTVAWFFIATADVTAIVTALSAVDN